MIVVPAFQPIIDIDKGCFTAAEVLARWYDKGRVILPSNLPDPPHWGQVDIEVAKYIQDNLALCHEQYPLLFINVSEQTLYSEVMYQAWTKLIRSIVKSDTTRIVIEITEGIQDAYLAARWNALADMGVELALDDYGDKYSSMERLMEYNWHYCKFDAKRLWSLADYPAILHCRRKGIQIIAEQVENVSLWESAKLLRLLWQQGFYHGKPAVLENHLNILRALP